MASRPPLMAQNPSFTGPVFHSRPGVRARTQNSVRPMPSIP